jgi:hypothetical protein
MPIPYHKAVKPLQTAPLEPAPCKCGRDVTVAPQEGGDRHSGPTQYCVRCECGVVEEFLGKDTGRRSVAVRQWNALRSK